MTDWTDARARWALVAVVAGAVATASFVTPPGGTAAAAPVGHVVGYAALAAALALALGVRAPGLLAAVAGATLFGVGVELVQPSVGRTASAWDAAANLAGAALGAAAAWLGGRGG